MKLFLLVGAVSITAFSAVDPPPKAETVRGRIVAYSNVKICRNTSALWSMIIRIEDSATRNTSRFIRVDFSLPCEDELPTWVTRNASVQTFHLTREPHERDAILNRFMDCKHENPPTNCDVPLWKRIFTKANDELPFGQKLPAYSWMEFPPAL